HIKPQTIFTPFQVLHILLRLRQSMCSCCFPRSTIHTPYMYAHSITHTHTHTHTHILPLSLVAPCSVEFSVEICAGFLPKLHSRRGQERRGEQRREEERRLHKMR